MTVPHVANRDADAQLPARRGAGGFEHSRSQNTELEFAEVAVHSEQEPINWVTRIIDAIVVDDPRLHQTVQLQQVMPIASVLSDPSGVKTQNRPDLTGAQPSHEALKAWTRYCPARRGETA